MSTVITSGNISFPYESQAFPEGDPVGHKIIRHNQNQMWLWRTTERWQHVVYHIFNRDVFRHY